MIREIIQTGMGIDLDGKKVGVLLYADDIVVLADTAVDLKALLDIISQWGSR